MDPTYHQRARHQGGAIHRRQLRAMGVDRAAIARLVARGELIEVRPHVFLAAAAPPTWAQRAWVALLEASPGAALSHRTAARLHRIGRVATSDIDVLELEDDWHRRGPSARHRSSLLPAHHLAVIEGFPVTSLPRTVFDLCGLVSSARRQRGLAALTEQQAARALDDALAGSLTVGSANTVLAELGGRGRPGTRLMRELMSVRGEGYVATESDLEDLVDAVLLSAGLPVPVRQRDLGSAAAPVGRVDFVYRSARVVIEADGRRHHTSLLDAEADRWRDTELAAAGWIVVRVTWKQLVHEPERFVAAIRAILIARDPSVFAATA